MEEVAKIATSLIAIDAKLKSAETALSTHKHKFADLLERPTTLGGYGITDGMTATEVAAAIQQAVSDLVNGSGAALDTLKELADALGNDPEFATTVSNALALRIRVDAAQSFTLAQKAQGRSNLDALGTVDKGKEGGVASLDGNGKVPSTQLPTMNYLPLAGGTLTGALQLQAAGNKVLRFIRMDGTRAAALYANADASPGFNIAVDDGAGANTKTFVFDVSGGLSVPNNLAVGSNIYLGASGQIASDGNVRGTRWGTGGVWLYDFLMSTNTLLGAYAYPRRSDGGKMTFNWNGQVGQPSWLWGGNDGGQMYVYDPRNFSVNYANNAGAVGGADRAYLEGVSYNYGYSRTRDYLMGESVPVGLMAFAKVRNSTTFNLWATVGGGDLLYSNANNGNTSPVAEAFNYGTWQVLSSSISGTSAGWVKRIG